MARLEVLLFDVDGTLADTERDGHRLAFNAAFKEAGLDWDWSVSLYGDLLKVTGGKERIRYYLDTFNTAFRGPADLDGFIAGLHAAKTRHYTDLLAKGAIPLRPGVRRLLNEARAGGLRLGIATTTTPVNVTALLRYSIDPDAESWFEVIAAGDIVPKKKPAPDIYEYALRELNVSPANCVALEDSGNGVRSAVGAGITTVVTVSDYAAKDDFTGAALVVDHLGEPNQPCHVANGDARSARLVDLALLRRIVEQAAG